VSQYHSGSPCLQRDVPLGGLAERGFFHFLAQRPVNTLKNQGYHLEHNYGHGDKYLATNFAILTFLAFLTDQIAQAIDAAFQGALAVYTTKRAVWEKVRQVFDRLPEGEGECVLLRRFPQCQCPSVP